MNDLDYDEEPSPEILQNAKASRENLNEKKKFLDIQSNKEKSEAKPVNINSRRSSNVNNYSLHTANKENDNSYDIHIDTSIKPKKGDKTPKSGGSLNEKLNENKNCDVSNDKIKTSQSQLHSNSQMYSNCNVQNCSKDFNQYDLQQLSYDLQKEYSHLRLDKNESFIERMNFDIFKRQTKEERLEKLIERNKVKIDEEERIKTFNRLIEDANRRLEAQEHLEEMKQKLEEDPLLVEPKKYRDEEWDDIYNDRFKKFQDEKDKKLDYKIKEKREIERLKEDEIVETVKTKKAPRYIIDQASKRMYDEAQRRKLKYENMKKDSGAEDDPSQKVSEKERELTPSKFKKFKIEHKYNFMVICLD